MKLGFAEIFFILIMFAGIWFAIFKFRLIYDSKKILENIEKKIEKQNKVFFNDGKEIKIKELLKQQNKVNVTMPVSIPRNKKNFLERLFKKNG